MVTDDSEMKKETKEKPHILSAVTGSICLSAEICLFLDVSFALTEHALSVQLMLMFFLAAAGIITLIAVRHRYSLWKPVMFIASLGIAILLLAAGVWYWFTKNAIYENPSDEQTSINTDETAQMSQSTFFKDKSVLLIVPHQDDDLNLMAGVFEKYISDGSRIKVLFTTNGDFIASNAEVRASEAVNTLGSYGIPAEDVIFLGYGNEWNSDVHLYNAPDNSVLESRAGRTEVYGTSAHQVWNEGIPYTRENFIKDLKNVITDVMPDVIYCVDFDDHVDHRASSLFFDRVIGMIKREYPDYCPDIFKGYAYPTAFYAPEDYYDVNILSTVAPTDASGISPQGAYRWEDRVRIPVAAETLSRSLLSSSTYQRTRMYASQSIRFQAPCIINGDKVFWKRDCTSKAYTAEVTASSGDASRLHDFMLKDTEDVMNPSDIFVAGTWIPDSNDMEKTAVLNFPNEVDISRIVLYDNASLTDNILNAEIVLTPSDGSEEISIMTGALYADGAPTEIRTESVSISRLSVRIVDWEGENAGLAELEVLASEQESSGSFVKLQNNKGDFVYDYYMDSEGEEFSVYAFGSSEDLSDYDVLCSNPDFSITVSDGKISVSCPAGSSGILSVMSKQADPATGLRVCDSVILRRGGTLMKIGQKIESFVYHKYSLFQQMVGYTLAKTVFHFLGGKNIIL